MRKLNLFFILLITVSIFSCQRESPEALRIVISDWEQSYSKRYGFYDNEDEFHYCTGVALAEDSVLIDSLYDYDVTGGFYSVEYKRDTFPMIVDTVFQDFIVYIQIYNNTWATIQYYDVLYLAEFNDNTIREFSFDGSGIKAGYCANEQIFIKTKSKKVTNIFWEEYKYQN